jgi:hypothetical protein
MTDAERRLMVNKCGELLHRTLIDIRALTWDWEPGNEKWIEELSDLTHNLPHFMVGTDDDSITGLRGAFVRFARRRWPHTDPEQTEYVRLLDMTEAEFDETYRRTSWPWPEPATTAAGV